MPPGVTRSFEAPPVIKVQLPLPAFPCLLPALRARLTPQEYRAEVLQEGQQTPLQMGDASWWQPAPLWGDMSYLAFSSFDSSTAENVLWLSQ